MNETIHISVLDRNDMGRLARTVETPGELLLSVLVSDPVAAVAATIDDDNWTAEESLRVQEIAQAPNDDARKAAKKKLPSIVPARFKGADRNKAEALGRQVIGHDFDHLAADTFEDACAHVRAVLPDRFLAIHTTASERDAAGWHLRVFELLDREATPDEWEQRVKPHMRSLGEHDPQALDISRLLYVPIRTAGYRHAVFEGPRTSLDALSAAVPVRAPDASKSVQRTTVAPGAASQAAAAASLAAAWPAPKTNRNATQLALAGALAHDDWAEADALEFLCTVCRAAGDEDRPKRENTIRSTYSKKASGEPFTGWSELTKYVDPVVVRHVRDLLNGTKALEQRFAEVQAAKAAPAPSDLLPTFPVAALPAVLRDFVMAQAEFTQVPIDLPAMLVLGACAGAIAGKVDLEVQPGYVEPLNVFAVVGLPTGERKSPNFDACFAPLQDAERAKVDAAAPVVAVAKAKRDALERTLARRKTEYANLDRADVPLERANGAAKPGGVEIEREIAALATKLEQTKIRAVPRLLVDDCTVERLASLMGEQNGRMCVASDEGTILSVVGGRYAKDGRGSFEVLLKGYSGTEIRIDRQSVDRPPVFVRRPRLTLCLAVQPIVIESMARDPNMRSQGLLARFLYALPTSKVGERKVDVSPMPSDTRARYEGVVKALASVAAPEERDLVDIPHIQLSTEALALHLDFRRRLEPRLHPKTGDLVEVLDWANKFGGHVARIAGVLHCVENGPTGEVSAGTMTAALTIGDYLLAHAVAAYGAMGTSIVARDAEGLLEWARKRGKTFTKRDVRRLGPRSIRNDKVRIDDALGDLLERHLFLCTSDVWSLAS